jgi:hypothetical protein
MMNSAEYGIQELYVIEKLNLANTDKQMVSYLLSLLTTRDRKVNIV